MEIEKNLVVSSAHITENDTRLLDRACSAYLAGLTVYSTEYWYMIHLDREIIKNLEERFSPEFVNLYKFALNHEEEFTFLKLDCDGDVLNDFPTFDW